MTKPKSATTANKPAPLFSWDDEEFATLRELEDAVATSLAQMDNVGHAEHLTEKDTDGEPARYAFEVHVRAFRIGEGDRENGPAPLARVVVYIEDNGVRGITCDRPFVDVVTIDKDIGEASDEFSIEVPGQPGHYGNVDFPPVSIEPAIVDETFTAAHNTPREVEEQEPGDEDGEAFRGGEAAAYQAEQQAAAQRLK